MNERVEILMATYNGARFLREQLDSILEQDDERWHLTVSDDGSTDGTEEILDEYVARYPDKMARHRSGKRFGNARDHFFHLMRTCSAAQMMFCDQDDVWYPNKVRKTLEALLRAGAEHGVQTPVLVFADQTPTDEKLRPLAPSLMRYQKQYFDHFDYRSILMQNVVTGGAMGINRSLAELGGQCADTSQVIMHDWWLAVVAARFGQVIYIDEPLSDYRQHGGNCVGAKDVGSAGQIASWSTHILNVRRSVVRKKAQAKMFCATYETEMTSEDMSFLNGFIRSRSGTLFYFKRRELIHGLYRLIGMMVLG